MSASRPVGAFVAELAGKRTSFLLHETLEKRIGGHFPNGRDLGFYWFVYTYVILIAEILHQKANGKYFFQIYEDGSCVEHILPAPHEVPADDVSDTVKAIIHQRCAAVPAPVGEIGTMERVNILRDYRRARSQIILEEEKKAGYVAAVGITTTDLNAFFRDLSKRFENIDTLLEPYADRLFHLAIIMRMNVEDAFLQHGGTFGFAANATIPIEPIKVVPELGTLYDEPMFNEFVG
jgi:hypothetical protein